MLILSLALAVSCNDWSDSADLVDDSLNIIANEQSAATAESDPDYPKNENTESQWPYYHYADYIKNDPQKEYCEDVVNTYIKLPVCYENTVEGLDFKVEWYRDTVFMHYYAIAKVSLTNNTGETLYYICSSKYANGFFVKNKEEHHYVEFSSEFSWTADGDSVVFLDNGDSFEFYSLYWIDDNFFSADELNEFEYVCRIDALFDFFQGETVKQYEFAFPIEVYIKND